jgi:hypothetical protein
MDDSAEDGHLEDGNHREHLADPNRFIDAYRLQRFLQDSADPYPIRLFDGNNKIENTASSHLIRASNRKMFPALLATITPTTFYI